MMAYMAEANGAKRSKLDDDTVNNRNHSSQPQQQQQWNSMDNDEGGGRRKREESERVNHILLVTILNPMYPITTDVLHTICSTHGQVLRIVVFKKHGVQAMVEFDSVESAKRAKESLHGADIYSGCCTLKIDFAKPSKLNVYKNDAESWDYTNPNLGSTKEGRPGPLLQEPRFGTAPMPYNGSQSLRHNSERGKPSSSARRSSHSEIPYSSSEEDSSRSGSLKQYSRSGERSYQDSSHKISSSASSRMRDDEYSLQSYYSYPENRSNSKSTARSSRSYSYSQRGSGLGGMDPMRGQAPFANGPYDRYENGYSRSMNGPSAPGGGGPVGPYHESAPYERYPDRGYSGSTKEEYPYRNGPIRSSPPGSGELVASGGSLAGPGRPMQQGAVMMVYGLTIEKMNSERLFNIFCLYGNVVRVKFLKSKEGCSMVQMGDALSVDRAMSNFNNTFMFGAKVQLGYSKQAFLSDVQQPHTLPDGSPSFKDFMGNKNNRFLNPEMASKNRIQPPTKTLHFFNTPPMIGENEMRDVFVEAEAPRPKAIKFFQSKTKETRNVNERSSSGLIEFENVTEAVEALSIMNHYPIKSSGGKFPFIMKLCFSSSRNPQNRME